MQGQVQSRARAGWPLELQEEERWQEKKSMFWACL